MKLTQWIEDVPNGGHPRGSYEAQMAIRRVFAKLNPSLDYDETMARLKAERGVKHAPKPATDMLKCSCGALFIRAPYGPPATYCGPCSALAVRRQKIEANARASKGAE